MKLQMALGLLILSGASFASVKIQEELYIPGLNPSVVSDLIKSGSVEIDHVTSQGFEVYGSHGLATYLDSQKIPYMDMKEINHKVFADYPTSAEIAQKLKSLVAKYPKIMKLVSIGKSEKSKDLLFVKISDNVENDEVEPEFKYISSMHGDEITGRELTTMLIEEVGKKYGSDPEITELVNNTEIYIMPSMNPDGSDLKQRANAKSSDLNRNFPDMISDSQSSPTGREIETQAVMAFQATRQFSLSANFHGGTIVANYPWDSKYDLFPFDALVKELSQGYANFNPDMKNSDEFPGGITNGAAWYIVRGGMQDWSYVWFNDLQITIELSHTKWPSYSEIPSFYKNNRDSMIWYMQQIHRGAGLKFRRSNISGTVEIKQMSPEVKSMGSYAFKGSEFYKVMPEGEYIFTVKERNRNTKNLRVRVEKDLVRKNGNYVFVD
jgi:hypothetical protein